MRPYPLFKSPEDPSSSLLVGIVSGKLQNRVRLPLAECASRQIRGSDCSCPTWSAQEGAKGTVGCPPDRNWRRGDMDFRERKTIPVLFFCGWRGRGFCTRIQGVTSHTPNNNRNRSRNEDSRKQECKRMVVHNVA